MTHGHALCWGLSLNLLHFISCKNSYNEFGSVLTILNILSEDIIYIGEI